MLRSTASPVVADGSHALYNTPEGLESLTLTEEKFKAQNLILPALSRANDDRGNKFEYAGCSSLKK